MAWKVSTVAWNVSRWPENFPGGKFPGGLESFSGGLESFPGGMFPGGLESFSGGLESFQVACKVSRWPVKFRGCLDSFQVKCKVSRWPGKFHGGLESFQVAWKFSIVAWKVSRWPDSVSQSVSIVNNISSRASCGLESFHGGLESHTSKVSRRHLHSPESHQSSLL